MGIHIDLRENERNGISYFKNLYKLFHAMQKSLIEKKLVSSFNELSIWYDIPNISSGGEQLIHMPLLEGSWEAARKIIFKGLKKQFPNTRDYLLENYRLSNNPLISFRIEGNLKVKLDDSQYHNIVLEMVSSARFRNFQGDLYLRTYSYYGHEFSDLFIGEGEIQLENWNKLNKCMDQIKELDFVQAFYVGEDMDCYKVIPLASRAYNKDEDQFMKNLFSSVSASRQLEKSKRDRTLSKLSSHEKDMFSRNIGAYNKNLIIKRILQHDIYTHEFPFYMGENNVTQIESSIDLISNNGSALHDVLETFLYQLSIALGHVVKPRPEFEKNFKSGLDKVKLTNHWKKTEIIEKIEEIDNGKTNLHDYFDK